MRDAVQTRAEAEAVAQAQETGQPVQVADETTENRDVMANPDGTFTLTTSPRPVRVKSGDSWRAVDTTLHAGADGTLAPSATTLDMRFSGGGTTPLVTLSAPTSTGASSSLSFTWPHPLPTPSVAGSTATYHDVYPGVDMVITADVDTYSEVLVVHDAQAAANSDLAAIHLTASTTGGLTLTASDDDSLTAADTAGHPVFAGSTPVMWDSAGSTTADPVTATDAASAAVTPITVATGQTTAPSAQRTTAAAATTTSSTTDVTVVPDHDSLVGTAVTYPVYIDPQMSTHKEAWTEVTSTGWHYFNASQQAQVGFCEASFAAECGQDFLARSFWQMDTSPITARNGYKAQLYSATFNITQVHGANGCTAEWTDLWQAGPISSATVWPGTMANYISSYQSKAGDQCGGAANDPFNALEAAQMAVDGNWGQVTLGLRAPDESNHAQWKRFDNNPTLAVKFNFPPNKPSGLHVSHEVRCDGTAITPDAAPTLYATGSDNNPSPLHLAETFAVQRRTTDTEVARSPEVVIASGTTGQWTTSALATGDYRFHVTERNITNDGTDLWSGWSSDYAFTTRAKPTQKATITTVDYPANYWGPASNSPGTVTFQAPGAQHIVGYTYTLGTAGTEILPSTTDCNYNRAMGQSGGWVRAANNGTATTLLPALSPGLHTLYVEGFDDAHNITVESDPYTFYVAPVLENVQRSEAETAGSYTQPPGQGVALTPQATSGDRNWSGGYQLLFSGTAQGQSFSHTFTPTGEGDYELVAGLTLAKDYGIVSASLDGHPMAGGIDLYNPTVVTGQYSLGTAHLTEVPHTLTITVTDTNPASSGNRYQAGFDYLNLLTTNRYEPQQSAQVASEQPENQNIPLATQGNYGGLSLSDNAQLMFPATATGQSLDLKFFVPVEADYAMGITLTKDVDRGRLTVLVDGQPMLRTDSTPIDGYNATPVMYFQPLGGVHLTRWVQHVLTIKIAGTNPASTGVRYVAGIDYFTASAIVQSSTSTFLDARDNRGIGTSAAQPDLDTDGDGINAQTLADAGLAPGTTVTMGGAAFTMPAAPKADGSDNVLAIGQTIPLPAGQQIKASAIGLLAVATHGPLPPTTLRITYTDGSTQDSPVAAVPDWLTGSTDSAAVVLPNAMSRTTVDPARQPRLYAVFAPANPSKTIASASLPNYGTTFIPGSTTPALHVFAMAPRPAGTGWIGTWTAPADEAITPPAGGFADQTLRTVIHPNVTGGSLRVRVSNPFTNKPVTIDAATLAAHDLGAKTLTTPTALTFNGQASITLAAGAESYSDTIAYPATTGGDGNLVVSLHLPSAVAAAPVHHQATNPTYLAAGDTTTDTAATAFTTTLQDSYYVSAIDVTTNNASDGTVAVLGDQNTGVGTPTWVNDLAPALATNGMLIPGGLVDLSRNSGTTIATATTTANETVLDEPQTRTVVIALGANDVLNGATTITVEQQLAALVSGFKSYQRTNGSPLHIILTTIPALGLAGSDPREVVRQQVNNDILNNRDIIRANDVVDFDTPTRDPANPHNINPSYLTGGTHNAAYHQTLAQTLADAAATFPPAAEF